MSESKYNLKLENTPVGAIGDHNQVTQNIIVQSTDYQALMGRIEDKRSLLELQNDPLKRLKTAEELQQLEAELEQFKENIFRLAESFSKIEINTERLRQAKDYFEQGQFREADAILQAEEMVKDLNKLEQRDQQLDQQKAEVRASREQIANEFLIKAQLWATFYEQSNRFEQTCEYFAESLRALKTTDNLFAYAKFLQEHYQLDQANLYYTEVLEIYRNLGGLPNVAKTLNNLANLHSDTNEMAIAEKEYQEALQIYREVAVENPRSFLPDVARTLNNLAILHRNKNEMAISLSEYQEALQIYQELAGENPRSFLQYVATTLNNLANFHSDKNERLIAEQEYQEALQIRRELAVENPRSFLPDVAQTLNNLAALHYAKNEMAIALAEYQEALQIYQELAVENPRSFLPDVAMTLINLSIFYLQAQPDLEKSFALAQEVIEIAQQFPDLPSVQHYAEQARAVLQAILE
jgi:tetratricopeptide (TPR) repeat protein